MINEHVTEFAGKPVIDYEPKAEQLDVAAYHYRLSLEYDEERGSLMNKLTTFLEQAECEKVTGLVIGMGDWAQSWSETNEDIVAALAAAKLTLPNIKAIFLGDIISEENEISWIQQSEMSPIFLAYPQLEHFRVRGNEGLSLGMLHHENLRALIIETGGLSGSVVRQVAAADLPNLQHLELWLGSSSYGGDATLGDLSPIFAGNRFPKLTYLGLRDSDFTDQIAMVAAQSPIIERIKALDLSMGTLGDEGAQALLDCPAVRKLEKLDLHYHFLSKKMRQSLSQSGINVDISDPQGEYADPEDRYPAVTE